MLCNGPREFVLFFIEFVLFGYLEGISFVVVTISEGPLSKRFCVKRRTVC